MTKRSYGQYCGTAKALDVLGERWTLLVVRDLLLGPMRYGDLFAGLEGISTDLLASRLHTLMEYDVVEQVKLAPPAASTVYQLTERGRGLAPLVTQLSAFGGELLEPAVDTDKRINAGWALASMVSGYSSAAAPDAVYELNFDDQAYAISIVSNSAQLSRGPAVEPDVVVSGPELTMLSILLGDRSPDDRAITVT
ncbi:MAG: winged helix-turn-helix transcriptional regulator, partial [Acidimicrobiales bacterium]